MNKLIIAALIGAVCTGCVVTYRTSEVKVRKDAEGKVTGVEYIEREEQRVSELPSPFGGFLKEYGPKGQRD